MGKGKGVLYGRARSERGGRGYLIAALLHHDLFVEGLELLVLRALAVRKLARLLALKVYNFVLRLLRLDQFLHRAVRVHGRVLDDALVHHGLALAPQRADRACALIGRSGCETDRRAPVRQDLTACRGRPEAEGGEHVGV